MNNSPRRTPGINVKPSSSTAKDGAGSDLLSRLTRLPGARALAVIAMLAGAGACGGEETDETCEADPADLEGQGRPQVEPVQGGVESDGTNYRIRFNVPDFDATQLPGFDETCRKWPLIVDVELSLTETGIDPAAQSTQRVVVVGEQTVYGPGEDTVEFVVPQTASATATPTSYRLRLLRPIGQSTDGGSEAVAIDASERQPLTDFAPGELPPSDPPTNP